MKLSSLFSPVPTKLPVLASDEMIQLSIERGYDSFYAAPGYVQKFIDSFHYEGWELKAHTIARLVSIFHGDVKKGVVTYEAIEDDPALCVSYIDRTIRECK